MQVVMLSFDNGQSYSQSHLRNMAKTMKEMETLTIDLMPTSESLQKRSTYCLKRPGMCCLAASFNRFA